MNDLPDASDAAAIVVTGRRMMATFISYRASRRMTTRPAVMCFDPWLAASTLPSIQLLRCTSSVATS